MWLVVAEAMHVSLLAHQKLAMNRQCMGTRSDKKHGHQNDRDSHLPPKLQYKQWINLTGKYFIEYSSNSILIAITAIFLVVKATYRGVYLGSPYINTQLFYPLYLYNLEVSEASSLSSY